MSQVLHLNGDKPGRTVFVVAWEYDGGGGFDWYLGENDAHQAWLQECENADEFAGSEWTAYRFMAVVPESAAQDHITRLIDAKYADFVLTNATRYRKG